MTLNKKELIEKFHTLVFEHGQKWTTIAEQLNREGITTLKGLPWNGNNARIFYRPHCNKAQRPATKQLPNDSPSRAEWLDGAAIEDLKQMLEEWRARKGALGVMQAEVRPVFRGRRRNSGVHVNETILSRAMEKAKSEKVRTGGSLSLLVELLLWQYLGQPDDVLEPVDPRI